MQKKLHENHRQRQKEKFRKGLLAPHEHVELMLYYPLKRINTNEIAHELMNDLGGIKGIFCSDEERLMQIKGIGADTALFIRNIAEIMRLYELQNCHVEELLSSEYELYKFLNALFVGACNECVYMLSFSEKGKLIAYDKLSDGFFGKAVIMTRAAVKRAMKAGAASVIIAHNHPDGICIPSNTDKLSAEKLTDAFASAGIAVRAHYVVADGKCAEIL